jgi:hypothetical protein
VGRDDAGDENDGKGDEADMMGWQQRLLEVKIVKK